MRYSSEASLKMVEQHIARVTACTKCTKMVGPPVCGAVAKTSIIAIGQAPGPHEGRLGRPFAYTAGKTLFKWFGSIGIEESVYRANVNMSAVCRCFPGKPSSKTGSSKTGDRVPSKQEIENCSEYLKWEFEFHKPDLVIPIGKLAIEWTTGEKNLRLNDIIGKKSRRTLYGISFDMIALPHPSGLNAWNNMSPGKELIRKALGLIRKHPAVKLGLIDGP